MLFGFRARWIFSFIREAVTFLVGHRIFYVFRINTKELAPVFTKVVVVASRQRYKFLKVWVIFATRRSILLRKRTPEKEKTKKRERTERGEKKRERPKKKGPKPSPFLYIGK